MDGLPHLPDGGFGNPRYDYRHRSLVPKNKLEDDVSPKSVITDIRFISPASSSSSSMDHCPLSDANRTKLHQPHHDRGYSISDGESSDPETLLESSRVRNKVCSISKLDSQYCYRILFQTFNSLQRNCIKICKNELPPVHETMPKFTVLNTFVQLVARFASPPDRWRRHQRLIPWH